MNQHPPRVLALLFFILALLITVLPAGGHSSAAVNLAAIAVPPGAVSTRPPPDTPTSTTIASTLTPAATDTSTDGASAGTDTPTYTSTPAANPAVPTATPFPLPTPANQRPLAPQPSFTFTQTGHTVTGEFLGYWQQYGGLPVFGYPVSDVQVEKGYQVQYFQRERFEFHPEQKDAAYQVELGLLGLQISYLQQATFTPPNPNNASVNTAAAIYVSQTHRLLSGEFLKYWQARGNNEGLRLYGYPISDELQDGSLTVQYFERARFERHSDDQSGDPGKMTLALFGYEYYQYLINKQLPPPILLPTPTAGAGGYPFLSGPPHGAGIIAQLYGQDKGKVLNLITTANFHWVKQQILWKDSESPKGNYHWGELDNIVIAANAAGVKLIINVDKAPDWARDPATFGDGLDGFPKNPQDFGDFMGAMAARYQGRIAAYEIWNEPNLFNESGGTVSPPAYAELLIKAYPAIKAADPNAVVIMGAPAPTGVFDPKLAYDDVAWLNLIYTYKQGIIRSYYDVLGSHPYGYNNPPETLWPDQPSPAKEFKTHPSFYFRRVEQQRAVMEQFGEGNKQMWVTEFGWCSDKREGGFGWCNELDPATQADFIVRAIKMSKDKYPWMGVMTLWNLNFSTFQPGWTGPSLYSIINADFSPRPAYFAVRDENNR